MDDDSDRGEFGMPTIGSSHLLEPFDAPMTWYAKLDAEGIVVEHADGKGYSEEAVTPEAKRILEDLSIWMSRFLRKNRKYAMAQNVDLGAAGIIPDINRKTSVLIDRIWCGSGEVDEGTVEVVDDLLGHLMLLRDKLVHDDQCR